MKKITKVRIVLYAIIIVLIGSVLSIALFSGRVDAAILEEDGNHYLNLKSIYLFDSLEDKRFIKDYDISLWVENDNFERGEKIGGMNSLIIKSGDYKDGSLQKEYRLHSYSKTKTFIVLEKKSAPSSSIIVFNLKSDKATKVFYERLMALST